MNAVSQMLSARDVGNPDALLAHRSQVGLMARLGDENTVPSVGYIVRQAREMVQRNAELVSKLPQDKTRPSQPEKHAAARELTRITTAFLRSAADHIRANQDRLSEKVTRETNSKLSLSNDRVETEIRQFIAATVKTPEGVAQVSELARLDAKVASVIHSSPAFLLGIGPDVHQNMRLSIIKTHAPDAYAALDEMAELNRILPAYGKLERELNNGAWHNPTIAAEADTRVQIDG